MLHFVQLNIFSKQTIGTNKQTNKQAAAVPCAAFLETPTYKTREEAQTKGKRGYQQSKHMQQTNIVKKQTDK